MVQEQSIGTESLKKIILGDYKLVLPIDYYEYKLIEGVLKVFQDYDGPLDSFLDLGAHVGIATFEAFNRGCKRVIAVEPDHSNFGLLHYNIHMNGVKDKITAIPCAVGPNHGQFKLLKRIGVNSGQKSVVEMVESPDYTYIPISIVLTIGLKELIDYFGPIDFIKMDIEGGEWFILDSSIEDLDYIFKDVKTLHLEEHQLYDWDSDTFKLNIENLHKKLENIGFAEEHSTNRWRKS